MAVTAINDANSTGFVDRSEVIDDALRLLRIVGSVLLRESYAPPWAIALPDADELAGLLGVDRQGGGERLRVVAFHVVEFGHCQVRLTSVAGDGGTLDGDGHEWLLRAGDILIGFGGGAHCLSGGEAAKAEPIQTLLAGGPNIQRPVAVRGGDDTALLCGVFVLHDAQLNPLLSALPAVLHGQLARRGELHNLSGVARLLAEEIDRQALGGGFVVERLLEVLCVEAIRAHIEALPAHQTGWLSGVRDPLVGRVIAAIHQQPGDAWSVPRLADVVAMSPSRFAARFVAAVGDSPMAYVSKWRMSIACRELGAGRRSVDSIAASVGYDSAAAFSRAFKKTVGMSPAAWRAAERPAVVEAV